jgi:hypothetical protein
MTEPICPRCNAMLASYGRTQTVFTETLRDISTHLTALAENDAELKQMILGQGEELRALRERLDGRP